MIVLLLTGCAKTTLDRSASFAASDPQGLIVLGVVESGKQGGIVIGRFDAATRRITGVTNFGGNLGLHVGSEGIMLPGALDSKSRFYMFRMPPGDYAIIQAGAVVERDWGARAERVNVTRLVDFDSWTVRDNSPVFSVQAGEVVYAGDLLVDYAGFPARITVSADRVAMQAFLAGYPNVQAGAVVFRPIHGFAAN